MAWRQPGDKPLSEPCLLVYWCIYASLSLNELNSKKQARSSFNVHITEFLINGLEQKKRNSITNMLEVTSLYPNPSKQSSNFIFINIS